MPTPLHQATQVLRALHQALAARASERPAPAAEVQPTAPPAAPPPVEQAAASPSPEAQERLAKLGVLARHIEAVEEAGSEIEKSLLLIRTEQEKLDAACTALLQWPALKAAAQRPAALSFHRPKTKLVQEFAEYLRRHNSVAGAERRPPVTGRSSPPGRRNPSLKQNVAAWEKLHITPLARTIFEPLRALAAALDRADAILQKSKKVDSVFAPCRDFSAQVAALPLQKSLSVENREELIDTYREVRRLAALAAPSPFSELKRLIDEHLALLREKLADLRKGGVHA